MTCRGKRPAFEPYNVKLCVEFNTHDLINSTQKYPGCCSGNIASYNWQLSEIIFLLAIILDCTSSNNIFLLYLASYYWQVSRIILPLNVGKYSDYHQNVLLAIFQTMPILIKLLHSRNNFLFRTSHFIFSFDLSLLHFEISSSHERHQFKAHTHCKIISKSYHRLHISNPI